MTNPITAQVAVASEKVVKKLLPFGLDARAYLRGPVAPEVFAVAIRNRQLRLWTGTAQVNVVGSRKLRQAVVDVDEDRRSITHTFGIYVPRSQTVTSTTIHREFPIQIPNATLVDWKYTNYQAPPDPQFEHLGAWRTVTATMESPETHTSFLVGFDETRQFISQLPAHASSVKEAHELLQPPDLAPGWYRQGEWFFVPATEDEQRAIVQKERRAFKAYCPLESGSSHWTDNWARIGVAMFVSGTIIDNRRGHHRPLVLDGWYRVVRNREVFVEKVHRIFD